jgi:hypothetical protein
MVELDPLDDFFFVLVLAQPSAVAGFARMLKQF